MRHRNDIDGLRALAVLPILLFHAGVSALGGGFVGVDIFFVISGYLITSIILREADEDRFSILEFYRRRVARIFPALFVMVAVTIAAGCALMFVEELETLARSAAAAVGFVSNIFFWWSVDYFGQAAEAKPLLHTWSLGVEEQFYLLYPLLLVFLRRHWPDRLRTVLVLVTAASFLISLWQTRYAQPSAFYLLPSRAWELGLGALVATGLFPSLGTGRARSAAALAGLMLIAIGIVTIRDGSFFPAPSALIPCLGAALLIAYGERAATARVLGWKPLRAIGLISYSLYLWHWPIITFYRLQYGMVLTPAETLGLVAASFVAATASYFFVEQPFLRRLRRTSAWPVVAGGGVALASVAGAAIGVSVIATSIVRFPPEPQAIAGYVRYSRTADYREQFRRGTCFVSAGETFDAATCLALSATKPNVLLIGDSHAAQYWGALAQRFPGTNVMQATASGCRPTVALTGAERCTRIVDMALNRFVDRDRVDGVVLAGRWREREVDDVIRTVAFLKGKGLTVTVIGPTVEYAGGVPGMLARAMMTGDRALIDELRVDEREVLDRRMDLLVTAAGARYVSAYRRECPEGRCRLLASDGGPFHFDYGHLTLAAARHVVEGVPTL